MTPVDVVEGVQGGLAVTWLGWLVLMIALAVVQGRRPDPDRYSRPFPPLGALLPAAVLGAVIGMADSDGGPVYGALFFGVGLTCWVWTACVVLLTEVHEDEQDDDQ